MIKAPFNFVPLSEYVFFPEWADQISQDIPFRDGVSGSIQLKMTAKTPVFVRNGHNRNMEETSFSHTPGGKYFIPATSIKGCVRNVLEILGFGKMTFVQNKSFGLRDLNDSSYKSFFIRGIRCGWLQMKPTGGFVLYNWGTPKRISIEDIADHYKIPNLKNLITDERLFSSDERNYYTSVKYKYDLFVENGYDINFGSTSSKCLKANFSMDKKKKKRDCYCFNGNKEGYIVLTGQPGVRQQKLDNDGKLKWTGKLYEFIFLKPDREIELAVQPEIMEAFRTIHENSPAYIDLWKSHLLAGERIPVFFKLEVDKILSIGMPYMYKYPYNLKIYDAIPSTLCNPEHGDQENFKKDLVDCIFGYSFDKLSLKGRVQWGHAKVDGTPNPMECRKFIALSPHSSYYPIYKEGGRDWNAKGLISGRKRYVIREQELDNPGQDIERTLQVKSKKVDKGACMLPTGTSFDMTVTFHNLTRVELGALLSAITFHGNEDGCFHNIGFGKPFGYGKMEITNWVLNIYKEGENEEKDPYQYMSDFEEEMDKFIQNEEKNKSAKWVDTPQLKELFAMAHGIERNENPNYDYMSLEEYKDNKDNMQPLGRFTSMRNEEELKITTLKEKQEKKQEKRPIQEKKQEEKCKQEEFEPTSRIVGDKVKAHCFDFKKVHVDNHEYDIRLVIPKPLGIDAAALVGKSFYVTIGQITNAGKIEHVKYIKP